MVIVAGDQAPLKGGLLRWKALQELQEKDTIYFVQDADCPWKNTGSAKINIQNRWEGGNYLSLTQFFPWTLGISEELRLDARIQSIQQSLKMPPSLLWLAGPPTEKILYFEHQNPQIVHAIRQFITTEAEWAERLARMMGKKPEIPEILEEVKSIEEKGILSIYNEISSCLGCNSQIKSLVELFSKEPPVILESMPLHYFWEITEHGRRPVLTPKGILVPRGMALPLEFAARGWTLAHSALPYLDRVRNLRDQHLPGLKIPLIRISFNWELSPDPLEAIMTEYKAKKKRRGQQPFELRPQEIRKIREFWQSHPTPISYLILGGNLNPSFKEEVI